MYFDNSTGLCFGQRFSLFLTFLYTFLQMYFLFLLFYTLLSGITTALMLDIQDSTIIYIFSFGMDLELNCHATSTWTVKLVRRSI